MTAIAPPTSSRNRSGDARRGLKGRNGIMSISYTRSPSVTSRIRSSSVVPLPPSHFCFLLLQFLLFPFSPLSHFSFQYFSVSAFAPSPFPVKHLERFRGRSGLVR